MCGISGIVDKNGRPIEPALIERLTDLVAHRGPDGKGYYHGHNFALGHRRLSIIDLSEHGAQPMSYLDRFWITYNGEIYNYLEIRAELEKLGHQFSSGSDTEVILAAYAQWGAACLSRFNGMWAFAIFDKLHRRLFLARDRFGVKPLYYTESGEWFAFGSEIKQMLSLHAAPRANRQVVLEGMLTSIDGHTTDTYFKGISSFPQGHYGYYDLERHTLEVVRYYDLKIDPSVAGTSLDEAVGRFRELLETSVRLRLRSDVRVGTCLSGGLDSSAASGIASRFYHSVAKERFLAIHAKSIDRERDESDYAKCAADHLGLDLHTVEPRTEDFLATVDELVYTQEEPFGSPSMFMGWHVFQKAKALGCKVMLNGQGGDEVLLGYERYFAAYLRASSPFRFFQEAFAQSRNSRLSVRDVLLYSLYFTYPGLRIRRLKRRSFLLPHYQQQHDFRAVRESSRSFRDLKQLQIHEISTLQLPHLLRYEDRNSMRHSVETRLPFLDYRLVEFCVSLPVEFKIRQGWTKFVLRKAIEDVLPQKIAWRRDKLGFEAPERTWIGQSGGMMKSAVAQSQLLQEITDHARLVAEYDGLPLNLRWQYFMAAAWERRFGVAW